MKRLDRHPHRNSATVLPVNFDLTEDEEMLKALAERFVTDRYGPEMRSKYLANDHGFCPENWALMSELGLVAAMFGADNGGLGLGLTGLATIFEALGRGLVVEPLTESVVLAGGLFEALANDELKAQWLDSLVMGEKRLAFAHREHDARDNRAWVATRFDGATLSGAKSLVAAGAGADAYIVSARTAGQAHDADGIELFLVDAKAPGLTVRPWRLVDGTLCVSLTLDKVEGQRLGGSLAAIESAELRAMLVRTAEALGIMDRLFTETLDYLRTRKQFGVALASFQALQHRMVAQYSALEQARSLLYLAIVAENDDRAKLEKAIFGARAFIAEASVALGHEMIQMHGGMGVTDELVIGHGHKRLLMLSRWPESPEASLDRFAA